MEATTETEESKGTGAKGPAWSADELIPFGKYLLLDRIGGGATASVYRARPTGGEAGFKRVVAIKRVLPHMAGDPEFVRTFVREAKTAARLTHPNIVPITELGKVGDSFYMAMECVEGKDLGQVTRRLAKRDEVMPPVIAAWIAAKLCDALDHAHNLRDPAGNRVGTVHRDLSPTNIIIGYDGQVKLIDFGLAKAVGRAQQTNVDALKQKLGYMSPEMVKGRPLDARSDVFGVGVALYELLTARRVFEGANDMETLKLVGGASVPPPSAVTEDVPDALELILMKALKKDPGERFQTASEMGDALQQYINDTEPMFNTQRVAAWMDEHFATEREQEHARLVRLLDASEDPEVLKQRRKFFSTPLGVASAIKGEKRKRDSDATEVADVSAEALQMSVEEPAKPAEAGSPTVPATDKAAAPTPAAGTAAQAAEPTPTGDDDLVGEEPTSFYAGKAAPDDDATRVADPDAEPTGFYDAAGADLPGSPPTGSDAPTTIADQATLEAEVERAVAALQPVDAPTAVASTRPPPAPAPAGRPLANEAADGGFVDEATMALAADEVELLPVEEAAPDDLGIEEEATTIFFNTDEGIGVDDLYRESAFVPSSPPPAAFTPSMRPPTVAEIQHHRRTRTQDVPSPFVQRRQPPWLIAAGLVALCVGVALLVARTPLGSALGLRAPTGGSIEVRTRPEIGAIVKLDGVVRGSTPVRLEGVQEGRRRLDIEAEGYLPVLREVHLPGGATAIVDVTLEPVPKKEPSVPAAGSGAVATGGEAQGGEAGTANQQAPSEDQSPTRSYERDRLDQARAVPTKPHKRWSRPSAPRATAGADGVLMINSIPWSHVTIDGVDTGRNTPILNYRIPAGPHTIMMQTPDGQRHSEKVTVKSGETLRVTRRFTQ